MIQAIYLYKYHDEDLIGLLEVVGNKDFGTIVKDSLKILTRPGYVPKVAIPDGFVNNNKDYKDKYIYHLSLQSEKDEDIRNLISHIKKRQINAFIKMAVRFYIGVVPTLSSMLDIELIKTIPVYTPSGVIVFSNDISFAKPQRVLKERKVTNNTQSNKDNKEVVEEPNKDTLETKSNESTPIVVDVTTPKGVITSDNPVDTNDDTKINTINSFPTTDNTSDNVSNHSKNDCLLVDNSLELSTLNVSNLNDDDNDDEVDVLALLEGLLM